MENPNNLSAVDWLVEKLGLQTPFYKKNELIERAKEIFKQQIISAGNTCANKQAIQSIKVDLMSLEELEQYAKEEAINFGQEYYNETFLKKT